MWMFENSKGKRAERCEEASDALERSLQSAGGERAAAELVERLPEALRAHVSACEACGLFAEELVEVRALLGAREKKAEPGPYFLARVMNSIALRERQLERSSQTWAAVPRLAYRLTVLASLVLLIAGSWAYRLPAPATTASLNAPAAEGLIDAGPAQDDLLVSPAGR